MSPELGPDPDTFRWRASRDGTVFVSWQGRTIRTYRGAEAAKLLARLDGASDTEVQLALAKITGNYRHGNERR